MDHLKILHFLPVYKPAWRYGGPIQSVSQLCEGLTRQGAAVSVATTNADGPGKLAVQTDQPTMVDGVSVRYFDCIHTPWGIDSLALRKNINKVISESDIVHMSVMWQPLGIPVATAARQRGKPYIYSLRGGVNPWSWKMRKLKHRFYWWAFEQDTIRRASALHVTCQSEREEILNLGVGIGQKIIVVPNSLKPELFARNKGFGETFRQTMGFKPAEKIILSLGRINPKKGIDIFLKAAASVIRSSVDWFYVIAGPDENGYRNELERLVAELGVGEKVRFCGMLSGKNLLAAYSAADLFVLTSHNENFGMSVTEAMAASVPVLISDQVGISREIRQDEAGMVVPLELEAIRAALTRMMSSEEERNSYARHGLTCVKNRFDCDVVSGQMADAYYDILSLSQDHVVR